MYKLPYYLSLVSILVYFFIIKRKTKPKPVKNNNANKPELDEESKKAIWRTTDNAEASNQNDANLVFYDFSFNDFKNKCCSNNRTLLHLACESGEFELINQCFNGITRKEFKVLEQMKTEDNKTPIQLAIENGFDKKFEIFKQLNYVDHIEYGFTQNINSINIIHRLVEKNQTKKLQILLQYLTEHCLIDTVSFSLKNSNGKTPIDLAIDEENSEAIYLLNHFESNANKINKSKYNNDSIDLTNPILNIDNYERLAKVQLSKDRIRNLIFQGGGIKGLAYVGALERLEKEPDLLKFNEIERIGGTSAGAIVAVLLCCGYSLNAIAEIFKSDDSSDDRIDKKLNIKKLLLDSAIFRKEDLESLIQKFKNTFESGTGIEFIRKLNWSLVSNQDLLNNIVKSFEENKGLFSGNKFRDWIDCLIQEKLGVENAKFVDLQAKIEKNEASEYKYLFLTGSNLTTRKCQIFSHLHTPNMIISDAVRISMSIPFIFYPIRHLDSLYVDGGLFQNYPIRLFDTIRVGKNTEINFINNETLGFRLVSNDLKSRYESAFKNLEANSEATDESKMLAIFFMVFNFYNSIEESIHSERVKDQDRTIYINSLDISPIEFDLNEDGKAKLIESGRKGVEDFLESKQDKKVLKLKNEDGKYALAFFQKGEIFQKLNLLNEAEICFKKAYEMGFRRHIEGIIDKKLTGLNSIVLSIALSKDQYQSIFIGNYNGEILIWNLNLNEPIKILNDTEHTDPVKSIVAIEDNLLASGSGDKTIMIWNVNTGHLIRTLKGHTDEVNCLVVLKKDQLASGSNDGTVIIWDINTGEQLNKLKSESVGVGVSSLAVLNDNQLASGEINGEIKIWNLYTNEESKTLKGHSRDVLCLLELPNNQLASGSIDKTIRIWDTQAGTLIHILKGHTKKVNCLILLKDNKTFASAAWDKTIRIWELSSGEFNLLKTLNGHTKAVESLALLGDGRLVSGSWDKSIIIWK